MVFRRFAESVRDPTDRLIFLIRGLFPRDFSASGEETAIFFFKYNVSTHFKTLP